MSDRYRITGAGFLHCTDCGSMVMEGYRGEHNSFHLDLEAAVWAAGKALPPDLPPSMLQPADFSDDDHAEKVRLVPADEPEDVW